MDLAGEQMPHAREQRQDLEVQRLGLQRASRFDRPGPAHAAGSVELDELAVAGDAVAAGGATGARGTEGAPRPVRAPSARAPGAAGPSGGSDEIDPPRGSGSVRSARVPRTC